MSTASCRNADGGRMEQAVNFCEIDIGGAALRALGSGALWWAGERTLIVSDLHLGKAERMARRSGALLPPYEVEETLARLAAEIAATGPERVVCLGDSFDDDAARAGLSDEARHAIAGLQRGRHWVWVAGNHDPGARDAAVDDFRLGPLVFRHIAAPESEAEVSGHFHPKARIAFRGQSISRRCFLTDERRIILPAFGIYTGGLDCRDPAFAPYFPGNVSAIMTGERPCRLPLGRIAGRARRAL